MKMEESTVPREVKGKVLIVDDAPDTLEIIQRLLRYEGYDVTLPRRVKKGWRRWNRRSPRWS